MLKGIKSYPVLDTNVRAVGASPTF